VVVEEDDRWAEW